MSSPSQAVQIPRDREWRRNRAVELGLDPTFDWADWVLAESVAERQARQRRVQEGIMRSAEMRRQQARQALRQGRRVGEARRALKLLRRIPRPESRPSAVVGNPAPERTTTVRPREGRSTRRARSARAGPRSDDPSRPPGDTRFQLALAAALELDEHELAVLQDHLVIRLGWMLCRDLAVAA